VAVVPVIGNHLAPWPGRTHRHRITRNQDRAVRPV